MRRAVAVVLAFLLVGAACGSGSEPEPASPLPTLAPITSTTTETTTTTSQWTFPQVTPPTQAPPSVDGPAIEVVDPAHGATVGVAAYRFQGTTDPGCTVTAAGRYDAAVDEEGNWWVVLVLNPGGNVATFVATDPNGRSTEVPHPVYYSPGPSTEYGTWQRWTETNFVRPNGIAVGPDGDVWVTTYGGLVRWAGGEYEEITSHTWPDPVPWSVAFTHGDVWVAFYSDVARWDGTSWIIYSFQSDEEWASPIELAVGPDGTLWAAGAHLGVSRFDGTAWSRPQEIPGRGDVDALAVDTNGRVWVGTFWSGLWVLDGGDWWQEASGPVPVVSAGPDGDVWYALRDMSDMSNQTVAVWHIDAASGARIEYPMGGTSVWAIAPVGESAYIGTNPCPPEADARYGLWHLEAFEATHISGDWDDADRQILGVAVDDTGAIWLGGQTGLWRYDAGTIDHFMTDTYASFGIGFVEALPAGAVWAGSCDRSSIWDGTSWMHLPVPNADLWSCATAVGPDGTLWIAGWDGIARFEGEKWEIFGADASGVSWPELYPPCRDDVCEEPPWAVAVTADGEVWAAIINVDGGLYHRVDGRWVRTDLPEGAGAVRDIASEGESLWVATTDGVHRRQDGSWTSHPSSPSGPPSDMWYIGAGGGMVWAASWQELARFDGVRWLDVAVEGWSENPIMIVDDEGAAWRATFEGPMRIDASTTYLLELPAPAEAFVIEMAIGSDGSWWLVSGGCIHRWSPAPTSG